MKKHGMYRCVEVRRSDEHGCGIYENNEGQCCYDNHDAATETSTEASTPATKRKFRVTHSELLLKLFRKEK